MTASIDFYQVRERDGNRRAFVMAGTLLNRADAIPPDDVVNRMVIAFLARTAAEQHARECCWSVGVEPVNCGHTFRVAREVMDTRTNRRLQRLWSQTSPFVHNSFSLEINPKQFTKRARRLIS